MHPNMQIQYLCAHVHVRVHVCVCLLDHSQCQALSQTTTLSLFTGQNQIQACSSGLMNTL